MQEVNNADIMNMIKVGDSEKLIGADKRTEKAIRYREKRKIKLEEKAKLREERGSWFTRLRRNASKVKEAAVEGYKVYQEKRSKRENIGAKIGDWIADIPARHNDSLAKADAFIDKQTDILAIYIQNRVDKKSGLLAAKGEKFRDDVVKALLELKKAKSMAHLATGGINTTSFNSENIRNAADMMDAAERKIKVAEAQAVKFETKSTEYAGKATASNWASNFLKRVKGGMSLQPKLT